MITKKNNVKDYSATMTSTQKVSEGFAEAIYPIHFRAARSGEEHQQQAPPQLGVTISHCSEKSFAGGAAGAGR